MGRNALPFALGGLLLSASFAHADIVLSLPNFAVTSGTPYVYSAAGVASGQTIFGLNFLADWSAVAGNPWSSDLEVLVTAPNGATYDWDPLGGIPSSDPYYFDVRRPLAFPGGVASGGAWSFAFDTSYLGSIAALANVSMILRKEPTTLPELAIDTLTVPSVRFGDTSQSLSALDGPNGFGMGAWSGPDDVYALNWSGGPLVIDLLFAHSAGDLDLYLFGDVYATVLTAASQGVGDLEHIALANLAPGTYFIAIDGWNYSANSYELRLAPEPASVIMLTLAFISTAACRKARRRHGSQSGWNSTWAMAARRLL